MPPCFDDVPAFQVSFFLICNIFKILGRVSSNKGRMIEIDGEYIQASLIKYSIIYYHFLYFLKFKW